MYSLAACMSTAGAEYSGARSARAVDPAKMFARPCYLATRCCLERACQKVGAQRLTGGRVVGAALRAAFGGQCFALPWGAFGAP